MEKYPYNSILGEMEDMRAYLDTLFKGTSLGADYSRPGVLLTGCFLLYEEDFVLISGNMMMK